MVDENDFLCIQQALRYNERTNHVVGDHTACISNDVRVTVGKTEHLENVHATVHARNDGEVALTVVLDGKPHQLRMGKDERVLDVALNAGLDLPWSCRGGVCCTCRAKVMEGAVTMDKNFTLEPWETDKGFVLSCQARPTTDKLVVSYDER